MTILARFKVNPTCHNHTKTCKVVPFKLAPRQNAAMWLEALDPKQCKWPGDDFTPCPNERHGHKPYCAEHCARAYRKGEEIEG